MKIIFSIIFLISVSSQTLAANESVSENCYIQNIPVVVYRKGFSTGVENREPTDHILKFNSKRKKLFYYSELLGARKRTIEHHWYKNNNFIVKLSFKVGSDRWRVWSSKNINAHDGDKWEVRIIDESGCLINRDHINEAKHESFSEHQGTPWHTPSGTIRSLITSERKIDPDAFDLYKKNGLVKKLNTRGTYGDTPLLMAIKLKRKDAVIALLNSGADAYVWDASGETPLQVAKRLGNYSIIDQLESHIKKTFPVWAVTKTIVTTRVKLNQPIDRYKTYAVSGVPLYFFAEHMGIRDRKVKHQWIYKNKIEAEYDYNIEANIWHTHSKFVIPAKKTGLWILKVVDGENNILNRTKLNILRKKTSQTSPVPIDNNIQIKTIINLIHAWAPLEQVTYMLDLKSKTRVSNKVARAILYNAIESGNLGMIKYSRKLNLPIDEVVNNNVHKTPFLWAIDNKQFAVARYLVSLGAVVPEGYNFPWDE